MFPELRMRRLRRGEGIRALVRETMLSTDDLVYPLFVVHGRGRREPIGPMPGQFRLSVDQLVEEVQEAYELGIKGVLLFGVPRRKDELGSEAYSDDGIVQRATRALKEALPELVVMADVCLCGYTTHGHCGVVVDGRVDNDRTLELIARTALSLAGSGADVVAPSGMMDGQVRAIRKALDEEGFTDVAIMAYSAKYASCFYGPFREAAGSAPKFGDRRSYQMDPPNVREALLEMELDIREGADIVMVKPALAYLDVIRAAKERFLRPLAAYNVSGEYAMVKAAGRLGWMDEEGAMMEVLLGIKRAGADIILTYFAKDAARMLGRAA
ncbi:MAG: porphobilinogen synthase [Candidatus Latescibacterota bacterium]|nr:MAG: porphobilinogen synthase [Candidatus Latescibacterota bacterium]HDI00768.1 porphobilinogen synthase [Bacillota bacterium]